MSAKISCRNVWKVFGADPHGFMARHDNNPQNEHFRTEKYIGAVKDVSFDVYPGEILIIMGLSGSGKSTLIRAITRLNDPTSGEVIFDGADLMKASPSELIELRRHKMGMVFQHFGLLPHRTVLSNVAFPLEVRGAARTERIDRAREMIKLVGLEGRESYFPRELSGGQQQRVGIARSLAVGPDIWFLDEPFSALDPLIRREMQDEFLRLQKILKKTIVFITHDFDEAVRLGDRIGIMKDGRLVQLATPEAMVSNPADDYVREFTKNAPRDRIIKVGSIATRGVDNGVGAISAGARLCDAAAQVLSSANSINVVDDAGISVGTVTRRRYDPCALSGWPAVTVMDSHIAGEEVTTRPNWMPLVVTVASFVALVAFSKIFPFLDKWPDAWVVPARDWLTAAFAWAGAAMKPMTRMLSWLLSLPLSVMEGILFRGAPALGLPPLPWIALAGGATLLGHWIGGRGLALLAGVSTAYLALFGLWPDAMQTLAIVLVTVPLATIFGLALGIWAFRNPRFEKFLNACFDLMQATPHMAYLGPVVVLFGFGQVPAMLATFGFALPPMGRCTILGLRTVPADVVEAGQMAGCTKRQLLWKVQLPAAQQTLLLGVNQVVMQTLAMAVIASLVGASGLGQKLLFSLQQLQIGKAVEQGIAITLIAIVLDRLTRAYMRRAPEHATEGSGFFLRHAYSFAFAALVVVSLVGASTYPALAVLPKELTLSYGAPIDGAVRWISRELFPYIKPIRDAITIWVLLPLRDFYLWLPWPAVIGALSAVGWHFGGPKLALLPVVLLGVLLLTGFWTPLMLTIYLVTSATVISVLIGIPLGIWAARRPFAARIINTICDTLQTFPSFIYLIPVIMLFQTSDLSNVLAMLAYATVPSIRFTYLGLTRVPANTIEAAVASGTTPLQRLIKVELPIAFPEILLGINQTIMMALAMVAITALIGSRDLGQEIYKALPGADTGRGLIAGLGIAFIGIIADRLLGSWAKQRRRELGMAVE